MEPDSGASTPRGPSTPRSAAGSPRRWSAIDSMFGRAAGTGTQRQSWGDELHRKRSDPGGQLLAVTVCT